MPRLLRSLETPSAEVGFPPCHPRRRRVCSYSFLPAQMRPGASDTDARGLAAELHQVWAGLCVFGDHCHHVTWNRRSREAGLPGSDSAPLSPAGRGTVPTATRRPSSASLWRRRTGRLSLRPATVPAPPGPPPVLRHPDFTGPFISHGPQVPIHLSGRRHCLPHLDCSPRRAYPCKSRSQPLLTWSLAAPPVPMSPCPSVRHLPPPSKVNLPLLRRGLSHLRSGHPPSAMRVSSCPSVLHKHKPSPLCSGDTGAGRRGIPEDQRMRTPPAGFCECLTRAPPALRGPGCKQDKLPPVRQGHRAFQLQTRRGSAQVLQQPHRQAAHSGASQRGPIRKEGMKGKSRERPR